MPLCTLCSNYAGIVFIYRSIVHGVAKCSEITQSAYQEVFPEKGHLPRKCEISKPLN